MPSRETVRFSVPAAVLVTNGTQIAARRYDLVLYARQGYVRLTVDGIALSPAIAKAQAHLWRGGLEIGQYISANGRIEVRTDLTPEEGLLLSLFNLSTDTPAAFSVTLTGWRFGEIPS